VGGPGVQAVLGEDVVEAGECGSVEGSVFAECGGEDRWRGGAAESHEAVGQRGGELWFGRCSKLRREPPEGDDGGVEGVDQSGEPAAERAGRAAYRGPYGRVTRSLGEMTTWGSM